MTRLTTLGRNALIGVIALLLGIASVTAAVRVGDDDDRLAQTGPDTSAPATTTTSTTAAPSMTGAPGGASPTTAAPGPTTATTAAPPATTTPPTVLGSGGGSGLAEGGAGEVAMGREIPNTGIGSALGPGAALVGAGIGLRALLGRRRPG